MRVDLDDNRTVSATCRRHDSVLWAKTAPPGDDEYRIAATD